MSDSISLHHRSIAWYASQSTQCRGVRKWRADDDLGSEQRLTKRFDLLNLGKRDPSSQRPMGQNLIQSTEQNGKLYVPVQHPSPARGPHISGDYESESM